MSGLSQGQLGQGLFSSQAVEQSVHVRVSQSHSPVQSAVPALYLVVRADIRIVYIPHSHGELAVKPCQPKVANKLLDGGVVRHQRLIAEGGVGWPDSHHRQEWRCHHPLDESETTIKNMSAILQATWRIPTNASCQPTSNMENSTKWIVPTYKQHGEFHQVDRANLQATWRIPPSGSCQPTNNMEKYKIRVVPTYKQHGEFHQVDRANLQTTWRIPTNGSCQPTNNMEKYKIRVVPIYKQHGEFQQMHRANLQTTWRNTTNASCQPTNNMEKYNKCIVSTYKQHVMSYLETVASTRCACCSPKACV